MEQAQEPIGVLSMLHRLCCFFFWGGGGGGSNEVTGMGQMLCQNLPKNEGGHY